MGNKPIVTNVVNRCLGRSAISLAPSTILLADGALSDTR